jgi:hypothetical protein
LFKDARLQPGVVQYGFSICFFARRRPGFMPAEQTAQAAPDCIRDFSNSALPAATLR